MSGGGKAIGVRVQLRSSVAFGAFQVPVSPTGELKCHAYKNKKIVKYIYISINLFKQHQ